MFQNCKYRYNKTLITVNIVCLLPGETNQHQYKYIIVEEDWLYPAQAI